MSDMREALKRARAFVAQVATIPGGTWNEDARSCLKEIDAALSPPTEEAGKQAGKPMPDLIVTKGGVPFADQAEGLRQFKAAALKRPTEPMPSASDCEAGNCVRVTWTTENDELSCLVVDDENATKLQMWLEDDDRVHTTDAAPATRPTPATGEAVGAGADK